MNFERALEAGDDDLLELDLRVARRADELARRRGEAATPGLHCWLLAEREVLHGELADWLAEPPAVRDRRAIR